jgi:hypothetical protein
MDGTNGLEKTQENHQLQEPIKEKNNRNCIVYCNYFVVLGFSNV